MCMCVFQIVDEILDILSTLVFITACFLFLFLHSLPLIQIDVYSTPRVPLRKTRFTLPNFFLY